MLVARSAGPSGFKGKEFQEELAPFTGDLSKVKMESTFEFLECKNITKDLKVNVLSGGSTHLSLSGPLTELLSADEPNLSKHAENHTRLSALKATVLDEYGGYVPGAPGDHIRIRLGDHLLTQPLGTDGSATFNEISLAISAELLKSKMQRSSQKSIHELIVDAYHGPPDSDNTEEEPPKGADGSLKELQAVSRYLTVMPSGKPTQLAIHHKGQRLKLDQAADDTYVVSFAAGGQIQGITLAAANEVDRAFGPPFPDGTRLFIDGKELPGSAAATATFLKTGELPPDLPALLVPRIVADGARNIHLKLQVSGDTAAAAGRGQRKRGGSQQAASSEAHSVEARLRVEPLAGEPIQWKLRKSQRRSASQDAEALFPRWRGRQRARGRRSRRIWQRRIPKREAAPNSACDDRYRQLEASLFCEPGRRRRRRSW